MICSLTVSEETEVSNGSEMTDHLFAKCPDSVSEETDAGERSSQYGCHTGDLFARCLYCGSEKTDRTALQHLSLRRQIDRRSSVTFLSPFCL